jgi:hypothetical protein
MRGKPLKVCMLLRSTINLTDVAYGSCQCQGQVGLSRLPPSTHPQRLFLETSSRPGSDCLVH